MLAVKLGLFFATAVGVLGGGGLIFAGCDVGSDATSTSTSTGGFPDADDGFDKDAACDAIALKAERKPLNLFILIDKSSSMAGTKWDAAKTGLDTWAHDPSTEGISAGLGFFPNTPSTCDQMTYKEPTVAFGPLPTHADALIAGMTASAPDGFSSPVYPALGGAILKGIELAQNNPGVLSAVLLVTDGAPQGPAPMCGGKNPEDPAAIAELAATGFAFDPPVATYVVGLPGVDQAIANQIAVAGGSEAAILIGATNVAQEFRQALAKIRGDLLPCRYDIPEAVRTGDYMLTQVNVEITPGGGEAKVVPFDPTCAGEGWRYDDPTNPVAIVLCPASCGTLADDDKASIEILLGCATIVP